MMPVAPLVNNNVYHCFGLIKDLVIQDQLRVTLFIWQVVITA
jgi:hypothetical protein